MKYLVISLQCKRGVKLAKTANGVVETFDEERKITFKSELQLEDFLKSERDGFSKFKINFVKYYEFGKEINIKEPESTEDTVQALIDKYTKKDVELSGDSEAKIKQMEGIIKKLESKLDKLSKK